MAAVCEAAAQPPSQPPNIADSACVCIPVQGTMHNARVARVAPDVFVKWADGHTKWNDAHRFAAWRDVFLQHDAWTAYTARKRAVTALSSTVANTSAHVLRVLVQGAACTRSLAHATCVVEAVLGSEDVLAVSALRPAADDAQPALSVAELKRARRALGEPNAVFNPMGWQRGTCASGVACAVRTKKAAVRVVRLLTGGEPHAGYTAAWSRLMDHDADVPHRAPAHTQHAAETAVPHETPHAPPAAPAHTNTYDAWMCAWRDVMAGAGRGCDAAAHRSVRCLMLAAVTQDCHNPTSDNGAVLCIVNAMRQGAWPLGTDNPGTPRGVPVPTRAHGNDVHCPALAMLHVCLENHDVHRMWAAAVWYAAWGFHLIPMPTLMVQLYRVAASPSIPPASRVPGRALMAHFPLVGPLHKHHAAALTAPLTRPKSSDGALAYTEALLFQHEPDAMRPSWWWHDDVPLAPCLVTAHAASAKLVRSWYRGTRAQDRAESDAGAARALDARPTAGVPVSQQHALALSGTVDVAWCAAAWVQAHDAVHRPAAAHPEARAIVRSTPGAAARVASVDVVACPTDWLRNGFAGDAPCVPWNCVSPRCPESLQRGMHATLDKLQELPAGSPMHAVLHKARHTRLTLHKWVMYHADKARLRAGVLHNRAARRALEWVCPTAVPLTLPWPVHLNRTGVQNDQDVALLHSTSTAILRAHGVHHAPFAQRSCAAVTALCKRGVRRAAAAASPADSVVYVLDGGWLLQPPVGGVPPVLRAKGRPRSAYVIGPVSDEAVLLEATTRALLQAGGMGCAEWDGMQVLHTPYGVYTAFLRGAAYAAHEFTALSCPDAATRTRAALRRVAAVGGMRRAVARMVQTAVHRGVVRATSHPETLLRAAVAMGCTHDASLHSAGGVWVWGTAAAYPHLHDTHAEWNRGTLSSSGNSGSVSGESDVDDVCVPAKRFTVTRARYDSFPARARVVLDLLGLSCMTEHITQSYQHLVACA